MKAMAKFCMRLKWKLKDHVTSSREKTLAVGMITLLIVFLLYWASRPRLSERQYNEQKLEALIKEHGKKPYAPPRPTYRESKLVRVFFEPITEAPQQQPPKNDRDGSRVALVVDSERAHSSRDQLRPNHKVVSNDKDAFRIDKPVLSFQPNSSVFRSGSRTAELETKLAKLLLQKSDAGRKKLRGGPAQCTLYDLRKDLFVANDRDDDDCMLLNIRPDVTVCPHPNSVDTHVSRHLRAEGIWEPHIVIEFQNILWGNPDIGVIDIGAHIGIYSLIAASMGHKVVSVEPHLVNIRRLHKAVKQAHLEDMIKVVQNAISEERRNEVRLKLDNENLGGTALQWDGVEPCEEPNCPPVINTIVMDDLLEVINFKRAVIKIDIEGHENRAFRQSSVLFDEVYIPYIFMEWMKLRKYHGSDIDQSEDKTLVFQLVDDLTQRGYSAFSLVTGAKLLPTQWFAWTDDIIWKHELATFI